MFRQTSDKTHPQPSSTPRKKILINPLHLNERDAQYLSLLFSELRDAKILQKDTPYLMAPFYECTLTHTLIKRETNNCDTFEVEVIANEYPGTDLLDCYELQGVMVMKQYDATYLPSPGVLCVAVKAQLDPANLSPKQSKLLGVILMRAYHELDEKYFPAGLNTFELEVEHGIKLIVHFDLKYPIVARTRENYPEQVRFEVVGKSLGRGYFAEAFKIITTLVPYTDGSLHAIDRNRMLKMQLHEHEYVKPEYQKAALTPHLHAKRPVMTTRLKQKYSFLVSKYIEGHTLERFLNSDAKKQILTIDDRLHLSLAIIRALDHQVHQQGMIHRDISLGNIIANFDAREYPKAAYIDMGLSKFSNISDKGQVCGTLQFLAPEVRACLGSSKSSDIYSVGVVLSEIWRVNLRSHLQNVKALSRVVAGLFTGGLKDMSAVERSTVKQIIRKLCSEQPQQRGTLAEAETVFERLAFQRRQSKLNANNQRALQSVNELASNLRREIHDYCLLNAADWDIDCLRVAVERELLQFPDQPLLIHEFVTTLGMRALHACINRNSICEVLKSIASEYTSRREALCGSLEALKCVMSASDFSKVDPFYEQYLQMILASGVRHSALTPSCVDDVATLSQKFTRDIERVRAELDRIEQKGVLALSSQGDALPLPGSRLPAGLYGLFSPPLGLTAVPPEPSAAPAFQ